MGLFKDQAEKMEAAAKLHIAKARAAIDELEEAFTSDKSEPENDITTETQSINVNGVEQQGS